MVETEPVEYGGLLAEVALLIVEQCEAEALPLDALVRELADEESERKVVKELEVLNISEDAGLEGIDSELGVFGRPGLLDREDTVELGCVFSSEPRKVKILFQVL